MTKLLAEKPKGQRTGPQPALYLDPKSGATWSGRGRAPARLAGAKDRTKFLIAGAVSATESLKTEAGAKKAVLAKKAAAAKNAAPAKNAVTKKAAAKKSATPVDKKSVAVKTVAKKTPTKKAAVKKLKDQGTATAAPSVDASAQGPDVATTSMSA